MARLILTFNKQVIKEFPFEKDGMTIGRKPENDIQIDNLAVSSFHARIDKTGSDFILTDLQSTNGTFIKDKKIVSHKLKHGDNIVIGKHVLLFLASEKGAAEKAVSLAWRPTLCSGRHRYSRNFSSSATQSWGVLTPVSGSSAILRDTKGRSPWSHLVKQPKRCVSFWSGSLAFSRSKSHVLYCIAPRMPDPCEAPRPSGGRRSCPP